MHHWSLRRALVAAIATPAALLLVAGPASAHVAVTPETVTTGSDAQLSFSVLNERDNASTVKLELNLPTDTPIVGVSVRPVPGWSAALVTSKLDTPITMPDGDTVTEAVTKVTWTGGKIDPGQYQNFDLSVGPLPDKPGPLVFKVLQTYSSGEVVRWIDVTPPGGAEPEHPAAVVDLVAATQGETPASGAATPEASAPAAPVVTAAAPSTSDSVARVLGGLALVAGLAAVGIALTRRRGAPAAAGQPTDRETSSV